VEAFLRDFDMYFCKLFDGARHDSGPLRLGREDDRDYRRNRVDPRPKTLIFSDQLSFPLSPRHRAAASTGVRNPRSGIGTNCQ